MIQKNSNLADELKKEILKKAVVYEKTAKDKDFKPYKRSQKK